jgi:hypothetical protein
LDLNTCIIEEEFPLEVCHEEILPPVHQPPFTTALEQELNYTCRLSSDHLALIFDMRQDLEEKLHRHTILNSRLELLFDALSGMLEKI